MNFRVFRTKLAERFPVWGNSHVENSVTQSYILHQVNKSTILTDDCPTSFTNVAHVLRSTQNNAREIYNFHTRYFLSCRLTNENVPKTIAVIKHCPLLLLLLRLAYTYYKPLTARFLSSYATGTWQKPCFARREPSSGNASFINCCLF